MEAVWLSIVATFYSFTRCANESRTVLPKVLNVVLLALLVKAQVLIDSGIAICIPSFGKG